MWISGWNRINVEIVARVPWVIVLCLFLIAIILLVIVGLYAGYAQGLNRVALVALVLMLSVIFLLFVDFGRGQEGMLRVTQQAWVDLQRQFRAAQ